MALVFLIGIIVIACCALIWFIFKESKKDKVPFTVKWILIIHLALFAIAGFLGFLYGIYYIVGPEILGYQIED